MAIGPLCTSSLTWWNNAKGESPCDVYAQLNALCGQPSEFVFGYFCDFVSRITTEILFSRTYGRTCCLLSE
ncbi:hypothetical protein GALMADRAFT_249601 [Galerina marginata CBS 339.88]|uniref:Uncharacterized protein n=1 Tax=Galerina marginata (strain CBS 339.88) TaxID=685588 RepID=A0A067SXA7_GALM3|nr:hypothetical protein GALMADRAFT_249601 [Galerina marginata CBS 339.88]